MQNLIRKAFIQICILRNGQTSSFTIAKLSRRIEESFIEISHEKSIFCLNVYLGTVCASARNKELKKAEEYSVKMIDICEDYIQSMKNQYSLIANIHISVSNFMMKEYGKANSLFKIILEQELEYIEHDKTHPFLEQIYLHLAIMYDSFGEYNYGLFMWKNLLKLHKKAYSETSSYVCKDYVNISRWHQKLGETNKALFNVSHLFVIF